MTDDDVGQEPTIKELARCGAVHVRRCHGQALVYHWQGPPYRRCWVVRVRLHPRGLWVTSDRRLAVALRYAAQQAEARAEEDER